MYIYIGFSTVHIQYAVFYILDREILDVNISREPIIKAAITLQTEYMLEPTRNRTIVDSIESNAYYQVYIYYYSIQCI